MLFDVLFGLVKLGLCRKFKFDDFWECENEGWEENLDDFELFVVIRGGGFDLLEVLMIWILLFVFIWLVIDMDILFCGLFRRVFLEFFGLFECIIFILFFMILMIFGWVFFVEEFFMSFFLGILFYGLFVSKLLKEFEEFLFWIFWRLIFGFGGCILEVFLFFLWILRRFDVLICLNFVLSWKLYLYLLFVCKYL